MLVGSLCQQYQRQYGHVTDAAHTIANKHSTGCPVGVTTSTSYFVYGLEPKLLHDTALGLWGTHAAEMQESSCFHITCDS